MPLPFVDTNVFLRHLLSDHADHSPRSTAYLKRVEQGDVEIEIGDTVVFEVVFTLERHYRQPKEAIRDALLPILELPGIHLTGKSRYRTVFDYYVRLNISFADAFHAVLSQHGQAGEIVSFDRGFDRVPNLHRTEP